MAGAKRTRGDRVLGLVEKTILGFIAGAAAAIGVVEAVFLVQRIIDRATSAEITLRGVPLAESLPAELADASPAIVSAGYDTVTLVVDGAPDSARAALIVAAVVTSLLTIGICAAVAWLCLRVFVGRPFVRSATWGIGIVAILVIVAGMAAPFFTGLANAETAKALGLDELPALLIVFDAAPLGWGLALAVVAAAFEIGQRLQRDTQGLV